MRKMAGLLIFVIVLSIFSGSALADSKITYKPKINLKDIKNTTQEKTVKITKITKSRLLQVLYIVTIETCAGKNKLYSPELEMRSDKESLTVKISGLIMPNTCRTSEFFIRADNPDSISISFSNINSELQRIPH
ncbi:MAG: hypothetical protein EPO63_05690 [Candidatus Nitrosotenuis sp.]|nr:MAG: hypothetical protein EPO63_05690 [Candidatus Nitrosotenuis sp.]